jgi:hypothetical protein
LLPIVHLFVVTQRRVIVRLINMDGLVLIGQGSEWFWAMLTMIALTVTFLAIYRELSAQRAAVAFEQLQALEAEYLSDRMQYNGHRYVVGLRRGEDWTQLEPFLWIPSSSRSCPSSISGVTSIQRSSTQASARTSFAGGRSRPGSSSNSGVAYENPGELAGFGRLAVQMREIMAKRGVPAFETDPSSITGRLDWMIEGYARRVRIDEVKTRVIPPAPTPAPTSVS